MSTSTEITKVSTRHLVLNRIRTPDGHVLTSYGRHDFKVHIDGNGETYMVDGGIDYLRRNKNQEPYEELSVYSDASHDMVRNNMYWGSRGRDGSEPLNYILLKKLSINHIQAILETQIHIQDWVMEIFKTELELRIS
jgi:hypothetical protein